MRMEELAGEMCVGGEKRLFRGRMQVYQAVRLALYAASLGQYVRSAVDYVRRGEKAETSPPTWTKLSEQAEAAQPVQTAPGSVALFFVSSL